MKNSQINDIDADFSTNYRALGRSVYYCINDCYPGCHICPHLVIILQCFGILHPFFSAFKTALLTPPTVIILVMVNALARIEFTATHSLLQNFSS